MKHLKKIPFFLLLLPLFFCLHGSLENYGSVNGREVILLGLVVLLTGILLFGIIYLFTRDLSFTSLFTFFIGLWYLFFGAMHDWIKSKVWLGILHSYSHLLPVLLGLTIVWGVYLKRKKTVRTKFFAYLNVVLLVYCIIDTSLLLSKYFTPDKKQKDTIAFDNSKVKSMPNVYFMLFDEYAGFKSLKDSFGFANDSLYNFLQQKQFKELPVFSNYNYTLFSMSAIFNMRYVDTNYSVKKLTEHDFQLRANEIRNGAVFDIYKKMGYSIENYSIFDIGNLDGVNSQNSFLPLHIQLLSDKILHNRILRTSGFLFQNSFFYKQSWRLKVLYQHDTDNLNSERLVKKSATQTSVVPKFCYAHFMLPHFPFYKDSMSNYIDIQLAGSNTSINNKSLYLSYLKYTNSVIKSLVDTIINNDPKAVVVVMSDHGYRNYNTSGPEPYQFNNICFLRLPDKNYAPYTDSWSAVNFFRYLFNCQFGQNLPYLTDHTVVFP